MVVSLIPKCKELRLDVLDHEDVVNLGIHLFHAAHEPEGIENSVHWKSRVGKQVGNLLMIPFIPVSA